MTLILNGTVGEAFDLLCLSGKAVLCESKRTNEREAKFYDKDGNLIKRFGQKEFSLLLGEKLLKKQPDGSYTIRD